MLLSCLVGPRPNHAQWSAKGRKVKFFYRNKFPIALKKPFIERNNHYNGLHFLTSSFENDLFCKSL